MIAISSFKPFSKCTNEIKENQIKAFKSWLPVFDRVVYFGEPCDELYSCKTEFISTDVGKPSIKRLSECASQFGGWSSIINSDIIVTPKLKEVERKLNDLNCECAISKRWCTRQGSIVDNGLDFFCAVPEVWRKLAIRIPEEFTLGRIAWDQWTLSWLVSNYGRKCADVSPARICWHPPHSGREDQNWDIPKDDKYLKQFFWPTMTVY